MPISLRGLLARINLLLAAVAIAMFFVFPSAAGYFVYFILAWMFGTLVFLSVPSANRRIGAGSALRPGGSAPASPGPPPLPSGSAPLPSGPGSPPTSGIRFCIYCAADLPVGALACPACGRAVRWA